MRFASMKYCYAKRDKVFQEMIKCVYKIDCEKIGSIQLYRQAFSSFQPAHKVTATGTPSRFVYRKCSTFICVNIKLKLALKIDILYL